MNARYVADMARARLDGLARRLGSKRAATDCVAQISSDLSPSWILKFLTRQTDNPTVNQLDALVKALDKVDGLDVEAA